MTGAEAIVRTLEAGGIEVCFANPGTTELHLVAAIERHTRIRMVLALFEGVATGAADGYARMARKPAATLLHLGPGFGNGIANLHNARRSRSPVLNLVGDHAAYHLPFDPPLASDIEGLAHPVSAWVRRVEGAGFGGLDAAEALVAARTHPGQVATLIVPADAAWGEPATLGGVLTPADPPTVADTAIRAAKESFATGEPTLLLLGGTALLEEGLAHAARIAAATGCDLLVETSNPRLERGVGRPPVERVPYPVDQAIARLAGYRHVILAGALEPVGFFAYPGKPSRLLPHHVHEVVLARPTEDVAGALAWLAEEIGATRAATAGALPPTPPLPPSPSGPLTREAIGQVLAHVIPDGAIVVDESVTTGRILFGETHGAAPHTWLQLTGGAIGDGLPMATGAAIASPDRKVLSLQADGSGMYTLQALWTQAREGLDVTTVVFANRGYQILMGEMNSAEALKPGPRALEMIQLNRPTLDWVALARGMGVDGERVEECDALSAAIRRGLATPGPYLVEAVM